MIFRSHQSSQVGAGLPETGQGCHGESLSLNLKSNPFDEWGWKDDIMSVKFDIDPLGKFPASPNSIMEATGILTYWLEQGIDLGESARDALVNRYHFYTGPMTGGEIDKTGLYIYQDDPKMAPLVRADLPTETVYFYQYGIVGIVNKATGDQFVTRMD